MALSAGVRLGPYEILSPLGAGGMPIAVSPDGKLVSAEAPDGRTWLYSADGGEPAAMKWLAKGEALTQWSADGRFLYVRKSASLPAQVFRVELETGRRELWKELMPSDPAGVNRIFGLLVSADGKSYAYSYGRTLSDLYLVSGVR